MRELMMRDPGAGDAVVARATGRTLHEVLDEVAASHGAATVAFAGERTEVRLDELAADSARVAAGLRGSGIGPGDRIGVLCGNEEDFLLALFALSRLGACACPLPLPTAGRDGYADKIESIVTSGRITAVVVSRGLRRIRSVLANGLAGVRRLPMEDVRAAAGAPAPLPHVGQDAELILQFTSGSTANPKGVRLTHRNVVTCLAAIRAGMALTAEHDRLGIWLPLFHDMGLFGTLTAVLTGVPTTVWPPSAFVKDPARWLRQFVDRGCTVSTLPNFGYDYLVRAVPADEVTDFDLSGWRVAFNGAEPVAADSLDTFLAHFAPAGFAPAAMMPVYGLAEATLAVTFPPLGRGPAVDLVDRAVLAEQRRADPAEPGAGTRALVSVGAPVLGMAVRVADPDTGAVLPDRHVGEIQLRGASVTAGYVDEAGAVVQPFTPDGWLRTGDLGYLAAGELYVAGRLKEMLILRGANFFPDDVESAVRGDPGVHRGRCVAFVEEVAGRERMVLVAETTAGDDGRAAVVDRLRRLVGSATGLDDVLVLPTPPNTIPRTSSGKLQRIAASRRFT